MDRGVGWQANRPKAIIALNDETVEVRSGQADAPGGFDYWVLIPMNKHFRSIEN